MPSGCESADLRYELFDSVDLQGHFLENLQLTEPACEAFNLYLLNSVTLRMVVVLAALRRSPELSSGM